MNRIFGSDEPDIFDDLPDNLENAEIKEAQQLQEGEALEHLRRVVKVFVLC